MDKKCVLPQNTINIHGKQFVFMNINQKLLLSGPSLKKSEVADNNSKVYKDEVSCKVNLDPLKLSEKPQNSERSEQSDRYQKKGRKEDFTHFISIPFLDLNEKIYALQDEIQNNTEQALDDHYQDAALTHLTLCMLTLNSEDKKKAAIKVLEENKNEINALISETSVCLKGLGFFPSSFKKKNSKKQYARILYIKMEENGAFHSLEKLLDFLVKRFIDTGILREDQLSHINYDRNSNMFKGEKFHITLMREKVGYDFEVDGIMEKLGNFNLGNTQIKTVDLSTRFEYDENDNFYKPLHRIEIKK